MEKKLDGLLKEVAEVEVELSRADGAIVGIPYCSVIKLLMAVVAGQPVSAKTSA